MNIENISEGVIPSPLEKIVGTYAIHGNCLDSINDPIESPYVSGFDAEHPMPTFEELKNAGFSDHIANQILNGEKHCYSPKELFNVLYSENPLEAYKVMMDAKTNDFLKKSDNLIDEIQNELGISI